MIKKILLYTICLLPWFISYSIPINYDYYKEIILPFFAPPNLFYQIAWTIIYILVAYTIYSIIIVYKKQDIPKSYKITLLINYIANQSFTIVFFNLQNNFLGFVSCFITLISTLFLYEETSLLQSNKKYLIIPYILLSIFATILSLSIYILNI